MVEVAQRLGIELVELTRPTPVPSTPGAMFKQLEIAHQALNADVVINLPKLKTHSQMLLTLGVKNLFGTIVAQRKAEWHYMAGADRDTFASLHLDIYQALKPALTLLDGVWGMEGHGPSNGRPRRLNLIAAAKDAVALDVSICRLLGARLRSFPLYRAARSRGMGETDLSKITFKGESLQSFEVIDFQIPKLDSLGVLPGMFDWVSKRFLVSKPVQFESSCVACGQCSEICPAGAIRLKNKRIAFDYDRCIRCYCCQEVCPEDGIHFHRGPLVRVLNSFNR
jgi:ferredoxin